MKTESDDMWALGKTIFLVIFLLTLIVNYYSMVKSMDNIPAKEYNTSTPSITNATLMLCTTIDSVVYTSTSREVKK